ncbi:transcriptional regulator, TetR family [Gottschalkia acidurici 9a]|uniref:Transcriptional regulator, TetR family n=2 Tax=Clostridium acidurici TaxID=1556 RepID=K0B5J0_GOTA9|nr:transcriptional regulator, TetR family [Gottschalkia acidurici 9a]
MLDIIKQAGLSKGRIYRYFSDINDVIIELINRETCRYDYKSNIDIITNHNNEYEIIIEDLFEFLGKHINESPDISGKYYHNMYGHTIAIEYNKAKKKSSTFL